MSPPQISIPDKQTPPFVPLKINQPSPPVIISRSAEIKLLVTLYYLHVPDITNMFTYRQDTHSQN